MKKLLTLACAALISVSALAGNNNSLPLFSFGIKAGYTANQQKFDINTLLSSDAFKKNAAGFNAGIVARMDIPVVPIYVQGELVYDWGKFKGVQLAEGLSTSDVTTNNLSIPVLVGVGIGSSNIVKIRANLGPVFNIMSTAKFSNLKNAESYENVFHRPAVTWTAGIGVDLFNIMVDVRYNGVFKKKEITKVGALASVNTTPTSWTISVGYLF